MSALALNAEALYLELLRGVRSLCTANTRLVGITSGGAWLAERLQRDLGLSGESGQVASVMHRDDLAQRGLSAGGQTRLPSEGGGAGGAPAAQERGVKGGGVQGQCARGMYLKNGSRRIAAAAASAWLAP